jgi:hypothetical protein
MESEVEKLEYKPQPFREEQEKAPPGLGNRETNEKKKKKKQTRS